MYSVGAVTTSVPKASTTPESESSIVELEEGRFRDLHISAGVRHIRGSVDGITVTGSATIAVQGVVSGYVIIDRGAKLCVDGLLSAKVERNEGLLVIAGQATLDPKSRHGRLGLAAGSVIRTRDRVFALGADGQLRRLVGMSARSNVDASVIHYFDDAVAPCEGWAP
jgi:hypothetical protein